MPTASRRTSACEVKSAAKASTAGFAEAARMSDGACSARARSRPVMATRAPIVASPIAVALPIPPVPPVMMTTLPAMGSVPTKVRASVSDRNTNGLAPVGAGLETLEEEPEWQHQLKEESGDREIEADVDPEDFSDGPPTKIGEPIQPGNPEQPGDRWGRERSTQGKNAPTP